jgi:hypothetical protein
MRMRRFIFIIFSILSLTTLAQEKKTVAILDPICRDNSVNSFYRQMVRGAIESIVTISNEYEAYDRSALDQIQNEQAFQRSGAVNDSQIRKMGELVGVDYVVVSEVIAYEEYLSAVFKILNVTTGKYDKTTDNYMKLKPDSVKNKCKEMASTLFLPTPPLSKEEKRRTLLAKGYIDLGLPSGTLWKNANEEGYYTFEQASRFTALPTKMQWNELIKYCHWSWSGWQSDNRGYIIVGPNGASIFLPVYGSRISDREYHCFGYGQAGYYWSSSVNSSGEPYDLFLYRTYYGSDSSAEEDKIELTETNNIKDGECVRLAY